MAFSAGLKSRQLLSENLANLGTRWVLVPPLNVQELGSSMMEHLGG